jgi:peptide-methionine (S)-S-oxide reductase
MEIALLGGGCFWCLEAVYQRVKGVEKVVSGYAGGRDPNPSYDAVCSGTSGHAEVIEIHFDPSVVSFRDLLEVFFVIHDPTTLNYQGNDVGSQYRSVIYAQNQQQLDTAKAIVKEIDSERIYQNPIVTEVKLAPVFYAAEKYHQNYFNQNPGQGYCMAVVAPKVSKFRNKFKQLWLDA